MPESKERPEPAPESTSPKLRIHPMIAEFARRGGRTGVVMLAGYAGEASEPGKVRLYLSLSDLSVYLEFAEDAILHVRELKWGGVVVWIGAHESVTGVRTLRGSARVVAAAIPRAFKLPPG
jgi:hypothetical protein